MTEELLEQLPPGTITPKDESVRMDFVPALWGALTGTVGPIFHEFESPLVITSGTETHDAKGEIVKHSETSLHWSGHAVDLRFWYLTVEQRHRVHALLIGALGRHFDVILEEDHLHIEYQPRRSLR